MQVTAAVLALALAPAPGGVRTVSFFEGGCQQFVPKSVGGIDTLAVTGVLSGKHVYLLYIGFGDSPAVLISYTPPGAGGPEDAAEWRRFLESLRPAR